MSDEIKFHKFCLRCGRKLKTDEARLRGMGKICAEKSKQEMTKKKLF